MSILFVLQSLEHRPQLKNLFHLLNMSKETLVIVFFLVTKKIGELFFSSISHMAFVKHIFQKFVGN
jgi:hypothetical protein